MGPADLDFAGICSADGWCLNVDVYGVVREAEVVWEAYLNGEVMVGGVS